MPRRTHSKGALIEVRHARTLHTPVVLANSGVGDTSRSDSNYEPVVRRRGGMGTKADVVATYSA
jgi:hypothetical protein